ERPLPGDRQSEEERIQPSVVESLADVSSRCKKEAFPVGRDGVELGTHRAVRLLSHPSLKHDEVAGDADETARKVLEVILALRKEDRGPSLLESTHDVVEDHSVSRFVARKGSVEILDGSLGVDCSGTKHCLADDESVFERTSSRLRLGVHLETDR